MPKQKPDAAYRKSGLWSDAWKRMKRNRLAVLGLVIFVVIVLLAIFADVITPYDYDMQDPANAFQSPSLRHPFGTDNYGRDLFTRVIRGGRVSLLIGIVACGFSALIGGALGAVAAYYGGALENVIMRVLDVMMAIPNTLLAIVIASALGPGIGNLILAVGISAIPTFGRILRASILSVKEQEYIEAARLIGCRDRQIIVHHIIPNVLSPLIVQATLRVATIIISAATLSFLGLGVQPPTPEWGQLLSAGRSYIRDYWFLVFFPGLAIMLTILSLNLLGDGLRDALDPRLKK